MKSIEILFKSIFFILILFSNFAFSKSLNKIEILGNDRISDETIKLFISLDINDEINDKTLNKILKDLYETDYFEDVSVNFEKNILSIKVVENPIIENIFYNGIKSSRILNIIKDETLVKSRSSFNEIKLKKDEIKIKNILKNLGYYKIISLNNDCF